MMSRVFAIHFVTILSVAIGCTKADASRLKIPFPKSLDSAAIAVDKLDDILKHSLILGNGDINALLYEEGGGLILRITKNDVWDARLDTSNDPPLPTIARLKQLANGEWPDRNWILPEGYKLEGKDSYHANPYPCPRACAIVRIGAQPEEPATREGRETLQVSARLDIRRGVAEVWGGSSDWKSAKVRALAQQNVFLIETPGEVHLISEKASYELPEAVKRRKKSIVWLHQKIPGDADWPGMSFAVALAVKGPRKAVAVVTSLESKDVVASAVKLAQKTVRSNVKDLIGRHEGQWRDFWSRSGIDLSEKLLGKTWYRNLYFLRCVTKPGVVCPGLFAGLISDKPAWHGDYHTNYNIQQTFWSCYITNHPELAEPYDKLISEYLPRARWLANKIFNCSGAYYPHVIFAYEPVYPDKCRSRNGRQYIHHVWGMTVGVAGFTVQPLWWRYKYQPDREYLKTVAYPAVRDVAVFYADFLDSCPLGKDSRVVVLPSVSPEHWGWTHQLERNRNCTFDIAMIRYTLEAAIEGAITLNCDKDLAERFGRKLSVLPEYPLSQDVPKVVVDVQDAPPIEYNIAVPATPVFPGDTITWRSSSEEKDLFINTLENVRWNGNNSMVILGVARARMSMPQTLEWLREEITLRLRPNATLTLNKLGHHFNSFGHYTEQFGISMAVSELLLQSVGNVIRVFPAWPIEKDASFCQLRTQGGFLVSASRSNGKDEPITVISTSGGKLSLLSPWPKIKLRRANAASVTLRPDAYGTIDADTTPGEKLIFLPVQDSEVNRNKMPFHHGSVAIEITTYHSDLHVMPCSVDKISLKIYPFGIDCPIVYMIFGIRL